MARLITSGFETGTWTGVVNTHGTPAILDSSTVPVRTGKYTARPQTTTTNSGFSYALPNLQEGYIKFSYYHTGSQTSATYQNIIGIRPTLALTHINLRHNLSTGLLFIMNHVTQVTGATGTSIINYNQHYNIELYFYLHNTAGKLHLKVNGITQFDLTNVNTYISGDFGQFLTFGGTNSFGGAYNVYIDDIVVNDTTGAIPEMSTWPGDTRIFVLKPSAPGDVTMLTPSDALKANWELVSDLPHDGDATFVYSDTANDYDLYGVEMQDVPPEFGNMKVVGVHTYSVARSTLSDDSMKCSIGLKSGLTEDWSADKSINEAYTELAGNFYSQNPDTSADWSLQDIEDLQIGFKVK